MQIYLNGRGNVDANVYKAHMAANEYESRCSFERNLDTGQWCIFIEIGREYDPPKIPVRGWDYVPEPDEITRYLHEHDMARHGQRLRTDMNARNQKRREDQWHAATDDLTDEVAEVMAHKIEKAGEHPWHTSRRKVGKKYS